MTNKTTKAFDNSCSIEGFIPKGTSLDDVIAKDKKELSEMGGGSFEAISLRMREIIDAATRDDEYRVGLSYNEYGEAIKPVTASYEARHGKNFFDNLKLREEYYESCTKYVATLPKTRGDGKVSIIQNLGGFGCQKCPFNDDFIGESDDIQIYNLDTGKQLIINPLTAHLAEDHNLLEKGNRYGISAGDFYRNFMPDVVIGFLRRRKENDG